MMALTYDRYGGPEVLTVAEVPKPEPAGAEVLVRVEAAGVSTGDRHLMRGEPFLVRLMFGVIRPKLTVLGSDVAGVVEAVGPGASGFAVGDPVVGHLADAGHGGFAEHVAATESAFVGLPADVSFDEAAAVPGSALAALQGLRKGGPLREGDRVLVNGASGGVGTFAVQIAKALGAHVTGVASARHAELVRSLGADEVLDYRVRDFTEGGERYDLVLDLAAHRPIGQPLRAVRPGGRYVFVGGATGPTLQAMLFGPVLSRLAGKRVEFLLTSADPDDLAEVIAMLAAGDVRPVVDRRFTLSEAPEAIRHLESGGGAGKIVIEVRPAARDHAEGSPT